MNRVKDFSCKKEQAKLSLSKVEEKLASLLSPAPWSCSTDGMLHFGAKIMLLNKKTNGALVFDTGDRMPGVDEAYAVTTNPKKTGPNMRTVFIVSKADPKDGYKDDIIHYGQKILIQTNPYAFPKTVLQILISHSFT